MGSNPFIGSICGYGLVVECDLPKVEIRVRFPLPAPMAPKVASAIMKTMSSVSPFVSARRGVGAFIERVAESRFFHDLFSIALLSVTALIFVASLAWLVLHVHPTDVPVPVRYSNLTGFDTLGPWYFPFVLLAECLGVAVFNTFFAYRSFQKNRMVSFFLLATSVVVAAFGGVIAAAFGSVR